MQGGENALRVVGREKAVEDDTLGQGRVNLRGKSDLSTHAEEEHHRADNGALLLLSLDDPVSLLGPSDRTWCLLASLLGSLHCPLRITATDRTGSVCLWLVVTWSNKQYQAGKIGLG